MHTAPELGISYNPCPHSDGGSNMTNAVTCEGLTAGSRVQYLADTKRGVTVYGSDDMVDCPDEQYE